MQNGAAENDKLNIDQSREKRLERIKAKQRDRGGIFKPREDNPFLDLLMSRDVSGRSPSKPRSKPRNSSVLRDARGVHAQNGVPEYKAAQRRKSVTSTVARKPGHKTRTPSVEPDHHTASTTTTGRSNTSNLSRDSSRRSDDLITKKGKSPAPPKKRPRQETGNSADDQVDGDADLPSPPKRLKKTSAPTLSKSAHASKSRRVGQSSKTVSQSRGRGKSKTRTERDASPIVSYDQNDGEPPKESTDIAVPKKKGRQKEASEVEQTRATSKARAKPRTSITNNAPKRPTKTTKSGQAKKKVIDTSNVMSASTARSTAKTNARKKAKLVPEPEPEPEPGRDSEEKGGTYYRTKLPKPRLDTVIEEDEEEAEGSSSIPARGGTLPSKQQQKKNDPDRTGTSQRNSATARTRKTGRKAGPRAKAVKEAVDRKEASNSNQNPVKIQQKAEETGPASKSKAKSGSLSSKSEQKPKAKPRPTSKKKPRVPTKPTFSTLETVTFTSPIKAANEDADELDFL